MKTTKKWSEMLLAGMTAMVLAFGLVLVGCDDGGGGDDSNQIYFNDGSKFLNEFFADFLETTSIHSRI
jgi:hypothetical protein